MITDLDDLRDVARMYSSALRSMSTDPRVAQSDTAILLACSQFLASVARRRTERWADEPLRQRHESALERILHLEEPEVEHLGDVVRISAGRAAANDLERAPWYTRAWMSMWGGW